ncbi:MAG: YciI family protein [Nocardioides sp.]
MRYLCFVKMDETKANPPQALMDAMGEHIGQGFASGVLLDTGGLYGTKDTVEFVVRDGNLTVTDGPYAEAKEVVGGWAIIKVDSEEQAEAEGRTMAELHLTHWPEWEGAIEIRRISDPDEAPAGS